MKKTLAVILVTLLLSGCSSTPSDPEETAFSEWTKTVYEYKEFKYESNADMKREAFYEIKPLLDEVALAIGENRMKVDTSVFNKDDWFLEQCKEFKTEGQMPRLEPLESPVVGSKDTIKIFGYTSPAKLSEALTKLKFTKKESKGDDFILWGSSVGYPFEPVKYKYTKQTENFTIEIEQDTAWNAFLWEQYKTIEDPGKYTKKPAMPSDKFAPFTVRIYFKPSCELVKPELSDFFNFNK